MICKNAESYHGTAGKTFLKHIVSDIPSATNQIRELIDQFKKENTPPNADGQVLRVLNRFALIAAAGTFVTSLGITGWPDEEAMWAAKQCFEAWLKERGGVSAQESHELLKQVRRYFEQHGDARFSIIGDLDEQKTINRVGYKKLIDGEWHFYVLPEGFKQEVISGFDTQVSISILIEKEWLIPDSNGKSTRAENLPCSANTTRCYRFDGSKVFADDI